MEFWRPKYHEYLNTEGDVVIIGSTFQRSRILKELEPETYQLSFEDWVEERTSSLLDLASQVLGTHDNAHRFEALKKARSSQNVVPFLGAGLSMPSGYPGWTNFLWSLQEESHVNAADLESLLLLGDYEGAAQLIHDDLGSALFNKQLQECFDRGCSATGAINLLPLVFPDSNVVTTNFDKLLESAFSGQSQGFDQTILGSHLGEALRILNTGGRYLLKLHGSCETVANRVLLRDEYNQAYGDTGTVGRFFSRFLFDVRIRIQCRLFLNSDVLFCSLRISGNLCTLFTRTHKFFIAHHFNTALNMKGIVLRVTIVFHVENMPQMLDRYQ